MELGFEKTNASKSMDGSAEKIPQHSDGLISDVLGGFGNAFKSHVDGTKQALGANVDLSYLGTENGAQRAGHIVGDATMFIGGALLMKKVPVVGQLAQGKVASIATGGMLGFSTPIHEGQTPLARLYNTGLGAGTMALMEFGPSQLGKLPGIKALPEASLASGVARYGVSNGVAGFANTEAQSFINTGHGASAADLAIGTLTFAALGTATHQIGSRVGSWQAARAEAKAAYLPENAPWQFKSVKDINVADLKPGEKLSPGNYRVSFMSEGVERKASLYVSEAAATGAERAPVVTHMHGLNPNGQAEKILPELNYFKLADQDGAVVAMLHGRDGLKGLGTFQSFHDVNFGYAKPAPGVAPYSDQISFGDMMRIVRAHVPNVNTDKIAVSGFSLGGKMANRIAATRSDVSVVASIHGTIDKFDEEIMSAALNKHPIDGMFILGTKDKVLPLKGGKSLLTLGLENNDLGRPLRQAEFWGASNGNRLSVASETPHLIRRNWTSTTGDNHVAEYVVKGGAHAIDGALPKRNLIQFLMGVPKPASVFDARQMSWDFMIDSLKRNNVRQQPGTVAQVG